MGGRDHSCEGCGRGGFNDPDGVCECVAPDNPSERIPDEEFFGTWEDRSRQNEQSLEVVQAELEVALRERDELDLRLSACDGEVVTMEADTADLKAERDEWKEASRQEASLAEFYRAEVAELKRRLGEKDER